MDITYDDIAKISQEMREKKDQWCRDLFSCFESADYDRGDKILIGQLVAENFKIPEWAKDRITVSLFIPSNTYVLLVGDKKEERKKWVFSDCALPISKDPRRIVNIGDMA